MCVQLYKKKEKKEKEKKEQFNRTISSFDVNIQSS